MDAQDPSDFHEGLAQAEEAAINPHKEWDRKCATTDSAGES